MFKILAGLGAALGVWAAMWRLGAFSFFTYDDAYIGLRYVANFLQHGKFEWNLGEPVEGYTDPLRLFLIAIPGAFGADLLESAQLLNMLCYFAFLVLLFFVFYKRLGIIVTLLLVSLAAACSPLIAWVWGALDPPVTVLFLASAQVVMLAAFENPAKRTTHMAALSAVFFSLALLTRLDSALYAVPAAAAWLLFDKTNRKNVFVFCAVIGGVVLAQLALRFYFYGDLLPNTFYNKVMGTPAATFESGINYVMRGYTENPYYYAAGLISLAALYFMRAPLRGFVMYAAASIVLSAVYVASVGGDFMPGFRFLLPWLPLCMLAIGLLFTPGADTARKEQVLRYGGLVIALLLLKALFALPSDLKSIDGTSIAGEKVGRYIAASWPKGVTVALNSAGVIPYFNLDKSFIDMMGLNDKHIAKRMVPDYGLEWQKKPGHGKGDGAYVLSRAPDYIILSSVAGDNGLNTPMFVSDLELGRMEEFHRCYAHKTVTLDWPEIVIKQKVVPGTTFPFSYYQRTCPKPKA
jgi:hypothetical protein